MAGAGARLRARVEALTAEEAAGAKTLAGAEAAAARATAEVEAAQQRRRVLLQHLAAEKDSAARARRELTEAKRRLARHEAIEAAKLKQARHEAIEAAKRKQARHEAIEAAKLKGVWRDWAGLPEELLVKVAETLVAQTEAGWAARLKARFPGWTEEMIQEEMAKRKREGNCLFMFARVCKPWRKAQLTVGGPLRTRVKSDVLLPGSVALVKWALAEGCPRKGFMRSCNMADFAAMYGHEKLVQWLSQHEGMVTSW